MLRKVIVIISAVIAIEAVSLNDGMFFMECKSQHNVPPSDLNLLKDHKLPETQQGKCMMACLLKKMKFLTNTGSLDLPRVKQWLAETYKSDVKKREIGNAVANECAKQIPKEGTNECDASIEILKCAKATAAKIKQKQAELAG